MNPNGIGLGLYICKSICGEMGGDVLCKSIPNRRTTFIFEVSGKITRGCFDKMQNIPQVEAPKDDPPAQFAALPQDERGAKNSENDIVLEEVENERQEEVLDADQGAAVAALL